MSVKDFKAGQLRTSKIIGSGSLDSGHPNGAPGLLIYSASSATDYAGGIDTSGDDAMLKNVGSDVFLFVSGSKNVDNWNLGGHVRKDITLFGGDVVISGTMFVENLVAEVDMTATGSVMISGSLVVSQSLTVGGSENSLSGKITGPFVAIRLESVAGGGTDEGSAIVWDSAGGATQADAAIWEGGGDLFLSASDDVHILAGGSGDGVIYLSSSFVDVGVQTGSGGFFTFVGKDTAFRVSGTIGSTGTTLRGGALFQGDAVVSGSLTTKRSLILDTSAGAQGQPPVATDDPKILFKTSDGTLETTKFHVGVDDSDSDKFIIGTGATLGASNTQALTIPASLVNGAIVFNEDNTNVDFRVKGPAAVGPDAISFIGKSQTVQLMSASLEVGPDWVYILSGGSGTSDDQRRALDTNFYVSGAMWSRGTVTKGTSVFGGDVFVSGTTYAKDLSVTDDFYVGDDLFVSGSTTLGETVHVAQLLQHKDDSDTYIEFTDDKIEIVAGAKAVISAQEGSLDKLQIGSMGAQANRFEQILILSGGAKESPDGALGTDVAIFFSGSVARRGYLSAGERGTAVFGGDVVISGTLSDADGEPLAGGVTSGTFKEISSGMLVQTGTVGFVGDEGWAYSVSNVGSDVYFFASGSTGLSGWPASRGVSVHRGVGVFGGDLVVSGGLHVSASVSHSVAPVYIGSSGDDGTSNPMIELRSDKKSSAATDYVIKTTTIDGVQYFDAGLDSATSGIKMDAGGHGVDINIDGTGGTDPKFDVNVADSTADTSISLRSEDGGIRLTTDASGKSIHLDANTTTEADSIHLDTAAGGILLDINAASGKKLHMDVESTDIDSIHLDTKGGINLGAEGSVFISGSQVMILSGAGTIGGSRSPDEADYNDINFFVSGSEGTRGSLVKGSALFGGDLAISGNLYVGIAQDKVTLTIDDVNDRVGIGAITPATQLNVEGTTRLQAVGNTTNYAELQVNADGALTIATTESDSDDDADITLDAEGTIVLDAADGRVDFKEAGASAFALDTSIDGTNAALFPLDTRDFIFKGGSTDSYPEIFRIDTSRSTLSVAINKKLTFGTAPATGSILGSGAWLHISGSPGILINSGSNSSAISANEANALDTILFVSGAQGSKDSDVRGTTVFGGDVVISGTLHGGSPLKIDGGMEITGTFEMKPKAGTTAIVRNPNGPVKVYAGTNLKLGTGAGVIDLLDLDDGAAGQIVLTGSGGISARSVELNSPGTLYFTGTTGGSVFVGPITGKNGISGSLTKLDDGTSYLIAGADTTITTGANGAVTIASSLETWTRNTAGRIYVSDTDDKVHIGGTGDPGGKVEINVADTENIDGLFIDFNETGGFTAFEIDSESESAMALKSVGFKAGYFKQDITSGYAGYFERNLNEAGSFPLVSLHENHTANEQPALQIRQDGTGDILRMRDGADIIHSFQDGGKVKLGGNDTVGTDVQTFISGTDSETGTGSNKRTQGVTLFSGDTVVSGGIYVKGNIYHEGDHDTSIRPAADRWRFDAGGSTLLSLDKGENTVALNPDQESISTIIQGPGKMGIAIDGAANRVLVLSGGGGTSYDEAAGVDVSFYVSGSVGSRGTAVRGASIFGGDVVTSGSITVLKGLSGSITQLHDGRSYLAAGSNVTITSASNGQVVISAGAGGSITAASGSTSVGSVSTIDFSKLGLLQNLGGGSIALTGTIGQAEEGSYADGLFTTFNPETPIGTAIDKLNEVLKFLAPSPAPNLSHIGTHGTIGATAKLSLGSTTGLPSPNTYNYVLVAGSAGLGSAVDVNQSYTVASGSNNIRMGVFGPNASIIRGDLADTAAANTYSNGTINYSGSTFGDADQGVLVLTVNGSTIRSIDLTDQVVGSGDPGTGTYSSVDGNSSGFINLSVTGSGYQSNGEAFGIFQNRTGKFQVGTATQRSGWNYARVQHTIGSTSYTANYIEWFNATNGTNPHTRDVRIDSVVLSGSGKHISGICYATGAEGKYISRIDNFYDFVYAENTISFSATNTSISSQTVPSPGSSVNAHLSQIHLTGSFQVSEASINAGTMASGSIAASFSVSHPIKTNMSNTGSITSSTFLVYSASQLASNQFEDFVYEDYRVKSGSYVNQAAVTAGGNVWNSTLSLTASEGEYAGQSDGLAFFVGKLKAPRQLTDSNGDFRIFDAGYALTGSGIYQPNYSSISSGTRTFYRYFRNESGAIARDFDFYISGSNTTIVPTTTALNSSRIRVYAKLPGTTDFLDLATAFIYNSGGHGTYDGANIGSFNNSLSSDNAVTNHISFGTGSIGTNEYVVIKVEADAGWTGHLAGMNAVFPAVAPGAVSAAPSVNELQIDTHSGGGSFASGRLAFGANNAIAGFINVTGSTGLSGSPRGYGTNVDVNGNYASDTNNNNNKRYGIIDTAGSVKTVSGDINGDTNASSNNFTADSFQNGHEGTLKLYVNQSGSHVHSLDLASFVGAGNPGSGTGTSANGNGSGFQTMSIVANGKDSSSLPDFRYFYRTGEFIVGASDQNANGWNWAKVVHEISGEADRETVYVEWVNDSNTNNITINDNASGSFGAVSYYTQSGVKYFDTAITPAATGTIAYRATNVYSNVYSNSNQAIRLTTLTNLTCQSIQVTGSAIVNTFSSSLSSNGMGLPLLNNSGDPDASIHITGSTTYTGGLSLPGDGSPFNSLTNVDPVATLTLRHPLDSNPTSTVTINNFLAYTGSSGASNINTAEKFRSEHFRLQSGSFDVQATTGSLQWDTTQSLLSSDAGHQTGLLVYGFSAANGYLCSPRNSNLPQGGDFRTTNNLTSPLGNVNYSGVTNERNYYRAFKNNTTSDQAVITLTVKGSATLVPRSGAGADTLGADDNVHIFVRIPGKTEWLDVAKAAAGGLNDGDGALSGDRDPTIDSGGAGNDVTFSSAFVGGDPASNGSGEHLVLRIQASHQWTGYITDIAISW